MNALDTSFSQSRSATHGASQQFTAVRLPIEETVDEDEEVVEKLKTCSPTELRRARQHHRRAIESLQEGGYSALPDDTRKELLAHLRSNLEALNHALSTGASDAAGSESADASDDSILPRLRAFVQGLW